MYVCGTFMGCVLCVSMCSVYMCSVCIALGYVMCVFMCGVCDVCMCLGGYVCVCIGMVFVYMCTWWVW